MSYRCQVGVVVTGKDRALQGVLEIDLPFVPFTAMELESLYSSEALIVDVVSWDVLSQMFDLWCLPVESGIRADSVIKRFAGNWDWEEMPMPEEVCEPEPTNGPTDEKMNDALRKILEGRARDMPRNPRETEKN